MKHKTWIVIGALGLIAVAALAFFWFLGQAFAPPGGIR